MQWKNIVVKQTDKAGVIVIINQCYRSMVSQTKSRETITWYSSMQIKNKRTFPSPKHNPETLKLTS